MRKVAWLLVALAIAIALTLTLGEAQPAPAATPGAEGVSCGGARICKQITSCAQAWACFRSGVYRLDGDKDGIPCETICSGGKR